MEYPPAPCWVLTGRAGRWGIWPEWDGGDTDRKASPTTAQRELAWRALLAPPLFLAPSRFIVPRSRFPPAPGGNTLSLRVHWNGSLPPRSLCPPRSFLRPHPWSPVFRVLSLSLNHRHPLQGDPQCAQPRPSLSQLPPGTSPSPSLRAQFSFSWILVPSPVPPAGVLFRLNATCLRNLPEGLSRTHSLALFFVLINTLGFFGVF